MKQYISRFLVLLSLSAVVTSASDETVDDEMPLAFKISSEMDPAADGVYVQQPEELVHGFPTFARDMELAQTESPMRLYRSMKGIWVITDSSEDDGGQFITSKPGPSPLGLKWRCFKDGKWPVDDTLSIQDSSADFSEVLLRRGPPQLITRTCGGGSGHASAPGYSYTSVPATFDCMTSSEFCFNDSPVYCNFSKELLAELTASLEETLQERSATSVVLEDELDLIDGNDQTRKLKEAVQEELVVASFRAYLTEPWFGLKTYIQVSDAILLFSVCASYGVAAGIFFASLYDKKGDK